jgi:hypothetical protein
MREELKPIMLSGGGTRNPTSPAPIQAEDVPQGNRRAGMRTADSNEIEMSLLGNGNKVD